MRLDPRSQPRQADTAAPASSDPDTAASRRAFLVRTGAVAGTVALAATGVGVDSAQAKTVTAAEPDTDVADGDPVVAYVSDVASGEIIVMAGDREVSIRDHKLARALARKVR